MKKNYLIILTTFIAFFGLSACGSSAPAPASSANANLDGLLLSQGTLDQSLSRTATSYTASVPYSVSEITLTPSVEDPGATIRVNALPVTNGQSSQQIPLSVGDNLVSITVTASDGNTRKIYQITVTRMASDTARLSALSLSTGAIPNFLPDQFYYNVTVDAYVDVVSVTAQPESSGATIRVDGKSVVPNQASSAISISEGETRTILIEVTAQDDSTRMTYSVNVTRLTLAQSNTSNINLSSLAISDGMLSPAFSAAHTNYDITVAKSVDSLTITATLQDLASTLEVAGAITASGSTTSPIFLNTGLNTLNIIVTSFDGNASKTYVLNVYRQPSNIATLATLGLSGLSLDQSFSSNTLAYTSTVEYSTNSVVLTPTLTDDTASITINNQAVANGQAKTVGLSIGSNPVSIKVTAEDATTINEYLIDVTRKAGDNAKLSNLVLSDGTLTPNFDPATTIYVASVANSVTNISLTPSLQAAAATMTINSVSAVSGNAVALPLVEGPNAFTIEVTSENGGIVQPYTVTVTRNRNAPFFTSASHYNVDENTTGVTTIVAEHDTGAAITYSMNGGADAALFNFDNNTGVLDFVSAPDAENATDADTNGVYEVTIRASATVNSVVYNTDLPITVSINDVNEAPSFTSATSVDANENSTAPITLTASDPENDSLTFSLSGGDDQAFFNINNGTGALSFKTAPDFESPADFNADNAYAVDVMVSDGNLSAIQSLIVNVLDVVEIPTQAPTVSIAYGPKTFKFSWPAVTSATFYRLYENPDDLSGFAQTGGDIYATTVDHVVPLYYRDNATYMVTACNSAGCGPNSNVVIPEVQLLSAVGYIKATNTNLTDAFGNAVSLSADGNTLAIGAPQEDGNGIGVNSGAESDNNCAGCGAVYVYTRDSASNTWTQVYIKASNVSGEFGTSVSLSADGNTLAVGAPSEDSIATNSGAAYIFARNPVDNTWSEEAYLKASNAGAGDIFGAALSLSADGTTLAVSATNEDSNGTGVDPAAQNDDSLLNAGAVYVFARSGSIWNQQAYIKGAGGSNYFNEFGDSVSLSSDGNTLAVGEPYRSNVTYTSLGAVYLYTRNPLDSTWSQHTTLAPPAFQQSYTYFGGDVSISGDGNTLAAGASGKEVVYVYTYDAINDIWIKEADVKGANTSLGDKFGASVSISDNGDMLAVGALREASTGTGVNSGMEFDNNAADSGATYVFSRTGTSWSQDAYIKAPNTQSGDFFGISTSLSSDGGTLAIGATQEDSSGTGVNSGAQANDSATDAGAVYLY